MPALKSANVAGVLSDMAAVSLVRMRVDNIGRPKAVVSFAVARQAGTGCSVLDDMVWCLPVGDGQLP